MAKLKNSRSWECLNCSSIFKQYYRERVGKAGKLCVEIVKEVNAE